MNRTVYGIDLGTTNSAIAVWDGDEARILKNLDGGESTPSVVFFTGVSAEGTDETLVGVQAKNAAAAAPESVVQFVKRLMGSKGPAYNFTAPSGREYTPEMLSSLILKKVCQDAQEYNGGQPVQDVVITVPAYFDDARRVATRQAGSIAGLNVLRVINEPTAAAIAFGVDTNRDGRVLVYDLGGGTFDVTVMEIRDGRFEVLATGGDSQLGGINFDQKILAMLVEKLSAQGITVDEEDDAVMADIREKAEKTKIQLSNVERSRPVFSIGGRPCRIEITRAEFEAAAQPLLQRTRLLLEDVMKSADIGWDTIDVPLLIGGSTKMPMVKAMLEQISGKKLSYAVDPDTAVAKGAAIFAGTLGRKAPEAAPAALPAGQTAPPVPAPASQSAPVCGQAAPPEPERPMMPAGPVGLASRITVQDVTSQSLGVVTTDGPGRFAKRLNTVVIPCNTPIPAKQSQLVCTVADNQTRILVEVTEGNDTELEFVKIIGSASLSMPPYPKGSPLEVIYAYDPDQTIYIEVIDRVTDKSLGNFEIERTANLSSEAVASAVSLVGRVQVE